MTFVRDEGEFINKLFDLFKTLCGLFVWICRLLLLLQYVVEYVSDDVENFLSLNVKINTIVINQMTLLELFQEDLNVINDAFCSEFIVLRHFVFF